MLRCGPTTIYREQIHLEVSSTLTISIHGSSCNMSTEDIVVLPQIGQGRHAETDGSPGKDGEFDKHIEHAETHQAPEGISGSKANAVAGIQLEKRLSLWQSVKVYRAAVAWSMIASLSIIMES